MQYFVIQVRTGFEDKFTRLALQGIDSDRERLFWPRRRLSIRKRGKRRDVEIAVFPGYVFLEAETLESTTYWTLRRANGFLHFLPDNTRVEPLSGADRDLIRHFLSFGEVLDKSKVQFDENKRIRVIHGALKGLEGRIVKVDRRKQRAKVSLSLYESPFLIDFGFDVLETMDAHEGKSK